jgi:hypothetical protein
MLVAVTDATTSRRAYVDALADLDRTTAELDVVGVIPGPLDTGPAPPLDEGQRAAIDAYRAAWENYLTARRQFYGT